MINKKSLKNLSPAKKGEVRNPHGRPKSEHCIADLMRKEFTPEILIAKYKELLDCGDEQVEVKVLTMIHERLEGKVVQPIGGIENKPLVITITKTVEKGEDDPPAD
jgi:hypothetical protein